MLKFEAFNLPTDGRTCVKEIESYSNNLTNEGWTMVGLAESASGDGDTRIAKLFGVYRQTESETIKALTEQLAKSEKAKGEAESKARSLEEQVRQNTQRIAKLMEEAATHRNIDRLRSAARERFGKAFTEIEDAVALTDPTK